MLGSHKNFRVEKISSIGLLVFILLFSYSSTSAIGTFNSPNQLNTTQLNFTGNYSFTNYDLNADGKGDILIFNMEVQVTSPGLFQFKEICVPGMTFHNSSSSYTVTPKSICYLNAYIVNFAQTGLTNLTVWFGYGTIFSVLTNPNLNEFTDADFNMNYQFYSYFSNNSVDGTSINSPNYSFSLSQIQGLSLSSTGVGVFNSFAHFPISDLINNRSVDDVHYWKETSFNPNMNDNTIDYTTLTFLNLNNLELSYNIKSIFDNGTLNFDNTFYSLQTPEYNITNNPNVVAPYIIPINESPTTLQSWYDRIWTAFDYSTSSSPNPSINYSFSNQFFSTTYSDTIFAYQNVTYHITYNLYTGLLETSNFISYDSSNLFFNYTISSIDSIPPIVPVTSSSLTTSSSSSGSLTTSTSVTTMSSLTGSVISTINTFDFLNNPFYVLVPLLIVSFYFRKRRS